MSVVTNDYAVMNEKNRLLRSYITKIAPGDTIESLAESPEFVPESAGRAAPADVTDVLRKLEAGEDLTPDEQFTAEAIIIPDQRPVVNIVDGDYTIDHVLWRHLRSDQAIHSRLRSVIRSIGRIELPDHPVRPYGGTGFVAGPELIMTNRHVAEIFASGLGLRDLAFRPGLAAGIDFERELGDTTSTILEVRSVEMIHPYWDMALLRVEGLTGHEPLPLSLRDPQDLLGGEVVCVGYPAFDDRSDVRVQNELFDGIFNVKRLQPGKLNGRASTVSFGKRLSAAAHDSSTLGGNSGSAIIDVPTGQVVALHFAGRYLDTNYGVPSADMAKDSRVTDAGVTFAGATSPQPGAWDEWWRGTESVAGTAPGVPVASAPGTGDAAVWTVPLEVTVRLGSPTMRVAAAPPPPPIAGTGDDAAGIEKMVQPIHDFDYGTRRGYDAEFLGVTVPMPTARRPSDLAKLADGGTEIPYHHFSIIMHRKRRLPLITAVNVDYSPGAKKPEPGRDYTRKPLSGLGVNDTELWFTDPRIPAEHQLPDRFFTKDEKAFDRGHVVRREDAAWGATYDEVRMGNGDTFHTTNCTPQVAGFNQSDGLTNWGALEKFIQDQAATERLSVLAGPVLAEDDPVFRGLDDAGVVQVKIPRQYWKVVVARTGAGLAAFGFVLRQDLSDVPLEFAVAEEWKQHMITITDLEKLLKNVRFAAAIKDADQAGTVLGEAVRAEQGLEMVG